MKDAIYLYLLPLFVVYAFSLPAWWYSKKIEYLIWWETLVPLGAFAIWIVALLMDLNYRISDGKSLANLVEIMLFIPAVNILSVYLKSFLLIKTVRRPMAGALVYLFINIVGALLIFFLTPMLTE